MKVIMLQLYDVTITKKTKALKKYNEGKTKAYLKYFSWK